MANIKPKFWSLSFGIGFGIAWILGLAIGGYLLMIAGLTEESNPVGAVYSSLGVMFLLSPILLVIARLVWLRNKN
jgi:hypothetical protein